MKTINDQQMNDLEYEIALIIDKRNIFSILFFSSQKKAVNIAFILPK